MVEQKHYDKTKDMTSSELEKYMSKNLKAGDYVKISAGIAKILAGPIIHNSRSYFWVKTKANGPISATVSDIDIIQGQ